MAFVLSDRIKETTTTTGTGTYTLGGATTGFETFTANLSNGDTTYYCCTDGTDFEVGLGTFASSGTTLARTTILSSSNSNNAVSWSSGTRNIFCTLPGAKAVFKDANGDVTFPDDEKAVFGTGSDLTISHESSGSHSVIRESGTGNLYIDASNLYLRASQSDSFAAHASFTAGGATQLYHNGTEKFITESTGIKATGNVLAEDGYIGFGDISSDNWGKIEFLSSDPTQFTSEFGNAVSLDNEQGSTNQQLFLFDTSSNDSRDLLGVAASGVAILSITGQGNIVFKRPNGDTSSDITLACPTPTANRTITLPNATGNVQLNQGDGESNGTFQNFQQEYQSSSYFTAGEYIEVASISPGGDSRNYSFTGTIMAQVSANIQMLTITGGIRFSSSGNMTYGILYNSSQVGDDYVEPVLWINTSTNNIKLLIQGKTGSIHKVGVNLTFFQRGNYDDITWNTTVVQDTSSVPSGYSEYIGEKAHSSKINGAVELYHNNIKKFETDANGVLIDVYATNNQEKGIFFRDGFTSSNIYNLSILTYDHNASNVNPDGLSINAYDGISFCTGSGTRSERMRIDSSGNVGIGTTSPSDKLTVNGSFSATTKSFDIEHPTKSNMRLRYGSLEGPENGVYVRGRLKGRHVINLPDYWTGLVYEDSITVNLTPIGNHQGLYIESIENNMVFVGGENNDKIDCFYTVYGERKDVEKLEVEYES